MTRFLLRSSFMLSALLASACVDDLPSSAGDGGVATAPVKLPPGCPPLSTAVPTTLSCTGLYGEAGSGPADKAVPTTHHREFTPGAQLWTDGADKKRWIAIPDGQQIDTSNPNAWVAPEGTRVWKEFGFNGKRAETRFMLKKDGMWLFATYVWDETDTEAKLVTKGADIPLPDGRVHAVPNTTEQCNQCHRGSPDKLLGFQQVLLGLPTAQGLTLSTLVAENKLSHPPARTNLVIPDDGTGMAADALSYIHVNCGVSCHNETGNAEANMSRMFLRIDPTTLDAPSPADWNIIKLTVDVPSRTANFFGFTRIIPGEPDQSLIVQLAGSRGNNMAMPPLGTRIVDAKGLALIREWITRRGGTRADAGVGMDGGGVVDAAVPDAGVVTIDAAVPDAEVADAGSPDTGVADAEVPDAGVADAEAADAGTADAEVPPPVVTPPVVDPPVVTPPVVEPPVTPPVVEPPVVTPPVVEPPVTPPVVEPPVTPPVEPPVTPPVVEPPVTPPVVDPVPADAGV